MSRVLVCFLPFPSAQDVHDPPSRPPFQKRNPNPTTRVLRLASSFARRRRCRCPTRRPHHPWRRPTLLRPELRRQHVSPRRHGNTTSSSSSTTQRIASRMSYRSSIQTTITTHRGGLRIGGHGHRRRRHQLIFVQRSCMRVPRRRFGRATSPFALHPSRP